MIYGEFSTDSGYKKTLNTDNLKDYTAIFCSNDMIAFGTLAALNELGISVPEEISIMGIDDIEYAKLVYPSLSTVDQSAYDLGVVSALSMVNHLSKTTIDPSYQLKQHLVIRNSVKTIQNNK